MARSWADVAKGHFDTAMHLADPAPELTKAALSAEPDLALLLEEMPLVPAMFEAIGAPPGLPPPPGLEYLGEILNGLADDEAESVDLKASSQASTQENDDSADELPGEFHHFHADYSPVAEAAPPLSASMERVLRIVEEIAGETFALNFRGVEAQLVTDEQGYERMDVYIRLTEGGVKARPPPLTSLQFALQRDMVGHCCWVYHIESSRDNKQLSVCCLPGSELCCWDVMRWGHCPRGSKCRWEHPEPVYVAIAVAGTFVNPSWDAFFPEPEPNTVVALADNFEDAYHAVDKSRSNTHSTAASIQAEEEPPVLCGVCDGTGALLREVCPLCDGQGSLT